MKKKLLAFLALIALALAALAFTTPARAGTFGAGTPAPPTGYKLTYSHDFTTQGNAGWVIQPGAGAHVSNSKSFGLGIELTATNQWAEAINPNVVIGPNTFVKALVYIPAAAGKDGMGRSYPAGSTANWPAWWTANTSSWPKAGEIDALEGIQGHSQFHGFYGATAATKVSTPNFNATPNSNGTGWITISFLRQNGKVTAWYGTHKEGTFSLPTNGNETLRFQDQSYSTNTCANCFGPTLLGAKSTAWLSRVSVWDVPATPTPTPTPTTPTPTPTQTGTAFSESCAAKTSTSDTGCGGIDLAPSSGQAPGFAAGQASQPNLIDVQPDGWSGSQGPATVAGNSYKDWTATETDTPPQANSAQILTYPSTTFNYYQINSPYNLSNITSLTSDYSETMPPVADKYTAENAYDIWLNNWATEVMIWTDVHYQGVDCGGPSWTPECSGSKLLGSFTYDGQKWSLYDNGGGINGFYMWIPDNGEALDAVSQSGGTGTVDLKAMLTQTAVSGGFTTAAPLTQIGYGWEVADTGGKPLPFQMHNIDVNLVK